MNHRTLTILSIILIIPCFIIGQNDTSSVFLGRSINQFRTISDSTKSQLRRVSIANQKEQDIREIPGGITLITKEEIKASGARDIMELLQTVSSMTFGRDVDDMVGLGIRGLWAHEGKYLIMLNGLPLNEMDFGSFGFGQRMNLNFISRVEIINGPGSIVYGGTAALGVINLITFDPGENDGSFINFESGYTANGLSAINGGINGNHFLGNETFISYSIALSNGNRSNAYHTTHSGNFFNYRDSTDIRSNEMFFKVQRKGLSAQIYSNEYNFGVVNNDYRIWMNNTVAEISYVSKIGNKSSITVRPQYTFQIPWSYQNTPDQTRMESNTRNSKAILNTMLNTKWSKRFETDFGIYAFRQESAHELIEHLVVDKDSEPLDNKHLMLGAAFFGDAQWRSKIGTWHAGGRYEWNNLVDMQFTPRIGYTVGFKNFYAKASYSNAYKIPTLENIHLGPEDGDLVIERVITTEFQLGYDISKKWNMQFCYFRNEINNPIVYVSDSIIFDAYINRASMANHGIEWQTSFQSKKSLIRLSATAYEALLNKTNLPEVEVEDSKSFLAMPQLKLNALGRYRLNKNIAFNTNLTYYGMFFSEEYTDQTYTETAVFEYKPTLLIGIDVDYTPVKLQDLSIRFGVNNLLNSEYYIASPYNSALDALRMNNRELKLILRYIITR